jgi:hypothetical protein
MAKARTIKDRLVEWDAKYRVKSIKNNQWKFHNAAKWVADDIVAAGPGFNVGTWALLERVEQIFGKRIRKRVLFNLFHSNV